MTENTQRDGQLQLQNIPVKNARILECSVLDETVVYGLATDSCLLLNISATRIWLACDGQRDVDEIIRHTGYTQSEVAQIISTLSDNGLLGTNSR